MVIVTCNGESHSLPIEFAIDCAKALAEAFHVDAIVMMPDCELTIAPPTFAL